MGSTTVARLLDRKVGKPLGTKDLFGMAPASTLEDERFNMTISGDCVVFRQLSFSSFSPFDRLMQNVKNSGSGRLVI
jgi:hypothetical protein